MGSTLVYLDEGFVQEVERIGEQEIGQEKARDTYDQKDESYERWKKDNPEYDTLTKKEIHKKLQEFEKECKKKLWWCSDSTFNRWWSKDPNRKRHKGRKCGH